MSAIARMCGILLLVSVIGGLTLAVVAVVSEAALKWRVERAVQLALNTCARCGHLSDRRIGLCPACVLLLIAGVVAPEDLPLDVRAALRWMPRQRPAPDPRTAPPGN